MRISKGLRLAIKKMGTRQALADALGIRIQSMTRWKAIPRRRVMSVHKVTGIPIDLLHQVKASLRVR